ncbi:MAG: SRPBCC family protein [Armatimonadota bacterium]|nr:SRPBCC family protein [Armatimonadota bacterium]MDR7404525.1 SRPBCC family protein [Armatimonadota bacterium]
MRTVHEATIPAPPQTVFDLVWDVEGWPRLDPAYRWCRVLERGAGAVRFEMGGRIRGWPARWTALLTGDRSEGWLRFRHVGGLTTGMEVVWVLRARPPGTHVVLAHDLTLRWPVGGRLACDLVVGPVFIDWIARRTLRAVAAAVSGGR